MFFTINPNLEKKNSSGEGGKGGGWGNGGGAARVGEF